MFDLHAPQPKALDKLLSLQGKTAVITGGSRGIGKQILTRFTEAGCKVVFTGRSLEALQAVEKEFKDKGSRQIFLLLRILIKQLTSQ